MTKKPDRCLVESIGEGDPHAYRELVDRYKTMVFTLALRILRNKEDAEEVAQDTFMKAYKGLSSFQGDSKFSTWLYKIAYRASLDHLKKNNRRIDQNSMDVSNAHYLKAAGDITDEMVHKERVTIIKQAIEALSPRDSAIITLFYMEERSLKEIAEVLGLSAAVIKVRLFRSRKQLATILQHKLEPEMTASYEKR